jgi:glycosyltransferase involved in cell wall biosynthesis
VEPLVTENRFKLTIIVPAYNEEGWIKDTLCQYLDHFVPLYGPLFRLLVVLNGCTDMTESIVKELANKYSQLHYIEFGQPLGKGGAIIQGLKQASGDRICFVDADNMVGPADTAKLVSALDQYDVAISSRWLDQSRPDPRPLLRRMISVGARLWTRWFLGLRFMDTQCGAKAMRGDVASKLAELLTEPGWAFDIDLLVTATALGYRVVEVPVNWKHRQRGSKIRIFRDVPKALMATLRIRRKRAVLRTQRGASHPTTT